MPTRPHSPLPQSSHRSPLGAGSLVAFLALGCAQDLEPHHEPAVLSQQTGALGACLPWAATVSGVAFTDAEATNTLAFLQKGTSTQLDAVTSVGPTRAAAIIASRPFATGSAGLTQLDAVSGVGPTLLGILKAQASTVWCPVAGCCTVAGSTPPPAAAGLVVNEFMLGSAGWIEIHNTGTLPVDLAG